MSNECDYGLDEVLNTVKKSIPIKFAADSFGANLTLERKGKTKGKP